MDCAERERQGCAYEMRNGSGLQAAKGNHGANTSDHTPMTRPRISSGTMVCSNSVGKLKKTASIKSGGEEKYERNRKTLGERKRQHRAEK